MSIKEYQHSLAEQIKNAHETEPSTTVMGVAIGDNRYLVQMIEVSEVIQAPRITPVALTQPWFLGMANVRGKLYGITDLGLYLGGEPVVLTAKSRILLVSSDYRINSGFMVSSMLGIRSLSDFKLIKAAKKTTSAIIPRQYQDSESRQWGEISLHDLIQDQNFLQIAR